MHLDIQLDDLPGVALDDEAYLVGIEKPERLQRTEEERLEFRKFMTMLLKAYNYGLEKGIIRDKYHFVDVFVEKYRDSREEFEWET